MAQSSVLTGVRLGMELKPGATKWAATTRPFITACGQMSHQVAESSLAQKETTESDAGAVQAMSQLKVVEEVRPEIVIKSSDLQIVEKAAHLTRQAAIELIQNANGDIKQALKNYVNQ